VHINKMKLSPACVAFTFLCDIEGCGTRRTERVGPSYDELRSAWATAKGAGWHLEKESESGGGRGRRAIWKALCPACNTLNWSGTPEYWED
jgi:hypothetical protein